MNTLMHADIFFVIASIGFVIIAGLAIVALINLIAILRNVRHISKKVDEGVGAITEGIVQDVRKSALYRMIFGTKRKR